MRERLGQYQILAPLGAGGMGEVYVARDPSLGRKVAIKLLPVRLSGDKETLARFTREARSASALNHPNIVTIHEVGMDQGSGSPYIVMEFIDGRDLRSILSNGPLPNRRTLDIAAQIADGLAAAHEQGIVHRDLKPENVMVTKDGYVKILDFGLAKIIRPAGEDEDTAQLDLPGTNPGTILGTVGYMSPEQATGKPLDFRSDQFALGAILYELSTGKPAFEADNAIDTLSAILHEEVPSITRFNVQAPQPFCWIVERLLSKNADERYSSTRDLARDLRNIRDRFATMTRSEEIPRPPKVSRERITIAAIVVGALLFAGGIAYVARQGNSNAPGASASSPSRKYLAVMPFKDLTGQPNGQLVVDGLAETLSARLAHFTSVQVMRPTAADLAANANPQQAGRNLGANIVLTGSMQRAGDRVRVAYEIVDLAQGTSRPGDLIEGSASELFTIQDKLADSIAASLQLGARAARAAPQDSSVPQPRYLEALGHLRRYDNEASVDSAIQILEDLAGQSGSASVQAALGRAYLYKFQLTHDTKWTVPAAAACERGLRNDPENFELHITLGQLRRRTGRASDAIAELKQALAQQPNSAEAILELAEDYNAAGDLKNAEQEYKKALQLQPKYWSGYSKLGGFYFTHGHYPEAASQFEKAMQLMPHDVRLRLNLAAAYQAMERYDEAITIYLDTIKKEPTAQAYFNLGTCYYSLGRYSDAARHYATAVAINANSYRYLASLADAYRWMPGSEKKANESYDHAIDLASRQSALNPRDVLAKSRLAECLAKRGRLREARTEIQAALDIDRTDGETMKRAAIVSLLSGNDEAAVKLLVDAIHAGYSRREIERDPEFAILRQKAVFHDVAQATTMTSGPH